MWDDKRKVGILNNFDLARFADQTGASGQDNTGTLPFMALDLLSEEGLRGEIPRHEAESFTWSLICLCLATVEGKNGKSYTLDPHPLHEWFQDCKVSRYAKIALQWHEHNKSNIPLVHRNAKTLAFALHEYWADRYLKQFQRPCKAAPPYQEPDDDRVFEDVLSIHDSPLASAPLEKVEEDLLEISEKFQQINWAA